MADILKRLAGPLALDDTAATIYTVPVGKTATLRDLHVLNESGGSVNFTLSVGLDAAGKRLYKAFPLAAGASLQRTGTIVLAAGDVLQAYGSVADALTLTASGVESS